MNTMLATVFHGVNDIRVDSVPKPSAGSGEAVIKTTATASRSLTSNKDTRFSETVRKACSKF